MTLNFSLPWPPSVNHYWRMFNNRMLISRQGRTYRNDVVKILLGLGSPRLEHEIVMDLIAHFPDNRRRDLDNLLKGPLDAICHAGVYRDDSQIIDLRIRRGDLVSGGRIDVSIQ